MNGLNSSLDLVGNDSPSSRKNRDDTTLYQTFIRDKPISSSSTAGSNFGEINAMKRLRRYIAKAYVTIYHP